MHKKDSFWVKTCMLVTCHVTHKDATCHIMVGLEKNATFHISAGPQGIGLDKNATSHFHGPPPG